MYTNPKDIENWSLRAKVGQLLQIGIGPNCRETEIGWPAREMRRAIKKVQPCGVRIYGQHAASPHFMAEYTNQLQQWAEDTAHELPLLISCDCEYGTGEIVQHGVQAYPLAMGRTAMNDTTFAKTVSAAIAKEMLSMGVTVNNQPVVDVNTNADNPVIGVRSPGSDPDTVAKYATALLEGIHTENQIAVAKHFPGHGDTNSDSHHEVPHVTYDRDILEQIHLRPFKTVIDKGVDCIMTSHIIVECIDPDHPATLSEPVLTDLLRSELGFNGVIITDSMAMNAITDSYSAGDAAVQALNSGADLILTGPVSTESLLETRDGILTAVETGKLKESRINESVERILQLKNAYELHNRKYNDPLTALKTTSQKTHETISRNAYEQSFAALKQDNLLPFSETTSLLLTGVRGVQVLESHFNRAFETVVGCELESSNDQSDSDHLAPSSVDRVSRDLDKLQSIATAVDVAVIITFSSREFPQYQQKIVEGLAEELPVLVISIGLPNEVNNLPRNVAYLATFIQERLGKPDPLPETAAEAIVSTVQQENTGEETIPFTP